MKATKMPMLKVGDKLTQADIDALNDVRRERDAMEKEVTDMSRMVASSRKHNGELQEELAIAAAAAEVWDAENKALHASARVGRMQGVHASHVTRSSDSSLYDVVCDRCGATDAPGSWGKLSDPCSRRPGVQPDGTPGSASNVLEQPHVEDDAFGEADMRRKASRLDNQRLEALTREAQGEVPVVQQPGETPRTDKHLGYVPERYQAIPEFQGIVNLARDLERSMNYYRDRERENTRELSRQLRVAVETPKRRELCTESGKPCIDEACPWCPNRAVESEVARP